MFKAKEDITSASLLVDLKHFAELMGMKERTLRTMIDSGSFRKYKSFPKKIKISHKTVRFRRDEIENFIDSLS